MIRTRDLLLYVLVLVFLVSAIGYTVVSDITVAQGKAVQTITHISSDESMATVYGAVAAKDTDDRAAYIAHMRAKIANGEGEIPGAPIVFTSVDSDSYGDVAGEISVTRSVSWCPLPQDVHEIALNWQSSEVTVSVMDGMRLIMQGDQAVAEDSAASFALLQLPIMKTRNGSDTCLAHEVIGVAQDGSLIRNDEAWRFVSAGESALVGYALDGFPIYGPRADTTGLDSCGGMNGGSGYQYHIRADEDFILGCFAGTPAEFIR